MKVARPSNAVAVVVPMTAPPAPVTVAVIVALLAGPLVIRLPPASRTVTLGCTSKSWPEATTAGVHVSSTVLAGAPRVIV